MQNIFLQNALNYAEKGLPVFPLGQRQKTPIYKGGFQQATKDTHQINTWWGCFPNSNIGIATGWMSGVWVLDIDGIEGEESLRRLEAEYGLLPPTVEVITGKGGRHLYFTMPKDRDIRCSVSRVAKAIDVRANGGYVVAPPSIHPNGRQYEWSVDSGSGFAHAPDWLIDLVLGAGEHVDGNKSPVDWLSILKGVTEGSRNDCLARLAGKLLGHRLDPQISLYLLAAWNDARCNPPLPHDELYKTFLSIAQIEVKKRGAI